MVNELQISDSTPTSPSSGVSSPASPSYELLTSPSHTIESPPPIPPRPKLQADITVEIDKTPSSSAKISSTEGQTSASIEQLDFSFDWSLSAPGIKSWLFFELVKWVSFIFICIDYHNFSTNLYHSVSLNPGSPSANYPNGVSPDTYYVCSHSPRIVTSDLTIFDKVPIALFFGLVMLLILYICGTLVGTVLDWHAVRMRQKRKKQGTKYKGFKANLKKFFTASIGVLLHLVAMTWMIATPAIHVQYATVNVECHEILAAGTLIGIGVLTIFLTSAFLVHECKKDWVSEDTLEFLVGLCAFTILILLCIYSGSNFSILLGHYQGFILSLISAVGGIIEAFHLYSHFC